MGCSEIGQDPSGPHVVSVPGIDRIRLRDQRSGVSCGGWIAVLMLLGFLTCLVAGSPWGCQSKARNTGSGGSNGTSAGGTGVQTGTGGAAGDASASTGLGGAAGDASTSTGAAGADPVGECTPHEVRCDGL